MKVSDIESNRSGRKKGEAMPKLRQLYFLSNLLQIETFFYEKKTIQ